MTTGHPGFDRELFRKGDPVLFRQLVREVSPRMLGMIRCYASDDDQADDLLQESWGQIYRKRNRFSGKGSFVGWALAVSRNVCRMSLRGTSKPVRVSLQDHRDIPDATEGPAARLTRRRRTEALYAALFGAHYLSGFVARSLSGSEPSMRRVDEPDGDAARSADGSV